MRNSKIREQSLARERTLTSTPSYVLSFADLSVDTFLIYGLLCRRSPRGAPFCNVPCTIQFQPGLEISWGEDSPGCDQLAINTLCHFLDCAGSAAGNRANCDNIADLYRVFAEEMLADMPENGGCIPFAEIEFWLARHLDSDDDDNVAA